jgi:nucleoid DNA-binding protein
VRVRRNPKTGEQITIPPTGAKVRVTLAQDMAEWAKDERNWL